MLVSIVQDPIFWMVVACCNIPLVVDQVWKLDVFHSNPKHFAREASCEGERAGRNTCQTARNFAWCSDLNSTISVASYGFEAFAI